MSSGVTIKNPEEIAARIREITAILMQYDELLNENSNAMIITEKKLILARERLMIRRGELMNALQQTRKMEKSSEKARILIKEYESKIALYNMQLQNISVHQNEMDSMKCEIDIIERKVASYARDHNILQRKINTMLTKISEIV